MLLRSWRPGRTDRQFPRPQGGRDRHPAVAGVDGRARHRHRRPIAAGYPDRHGLLGRHFRRVEKPGRRQTAAGVPDHAEGRRGDAFQGHGDAMMRKFAAALIAIASGTRAAPATEVKALITTAMQAAIVDLTPQFEKTTGNKVAISY